MPEQMESHSEKRDSIVVKRNAKGEYAWDIKVYHDSETEDIIDVISYIDDLDQRLRDKFIGIGDV